MATWVVRARSSSGQVTVDGIGPSTTLGELKLALAAKLSSDAGRIGVKAGFPPKLVDDSDGGATIASLGVQNGDALIVEDLPPKSGESSAAKTLERRGTLGTDEVAPSSIDGEIVRRVIPSDNSCLFNAITYLVLRDRTAGPSLRSVIASAVRDNPAEYNEAVLERKPDAYCEWIMHPDHWGGAVEVKILSAHFGVEIAVFDTQTQRVDIFGEEGKFQNRIMVVYDGIHYDALALSPAPGAPEDVDVTMFDVANEDVLAHAHRLVAAAHSKHQFVDVNKFSLRCLVCQAGLVGQKAATEHAKETGHANFGEYN